MYAYAHGCGQKCAGINTQRPIDVTPRCVGYAFIKILIYTYTYTYIYINLYAHTFMHIKPAPINEHI